MEIKKHINALMVFFCLLFSFLLYGNSVPGEFVYDDRVFSSREDLRKPIGLIHAWTWKTIPYSTTSGYRPLAYFTYSLTFNLFGESSVPFHITNILLHAFCGFLLFLFIRASGFSNTLSVFSTVLFLALPIHTENIANIKGREDILAAIGILLASWLLLNATRKPGKVNIFFLILSYVCFLLALFSKELMITMLPWFPFLYYLLREASLKRLIFISSGYALAAGLLFIVRSAVYKEAAYIVNRVEYIFNPLSTAEFNVRVWTNFKIIAMYVGKTFIPYNLSAGYQYNHFPLVSNPFTSIPTLIGILFTCLLVWFLTKRYWYKTACGVGIFFFLFSFIPLPKILFQASDIFAERWMYLPSAGLSLLVGWGIIQVYNRQKMGTLIAFSFLLVVYGFVIIQRNTIWLTRESFTKQFVVDAPQNSHAHTLLANLYFEQGKLTQARDEMAAALSIYKDNARLRRLTGRIAVREGKYAEADTLLYDIPELDPYFTDEHYLYAYMLQRLDKNSECVGYITRRYGDIPPTKELKFILGICYYQSGDKDTASRYIEFDAGKKAFKPKEDR